MQGKELGKVCDKIETYQTLWDIAKAALRGKFIDENAHIGEEEISQINNLAFYLKGERKEQTKPKANRRSWSRAEINEVKSWFFGKDPQNWQAFS